MAAKKPNLRSILPERKLKKEKGSKPIEREANIIVDRNRWWAATMLLIIALIIAMFQARANHKDYVEKDTQIYWVKLEPNAEYDVQLLDPFQAQADYAAFYQTTINSFIKQFVEKRYSKIPYTIKYDYGFITQFMSEQMASDFLGKQGFDASAVAAEFFACESCQEVTVKMRSLNHFSVEPSQLDGRPIELRRTNVFVEKRTRSASGAIIDKEGGIVTLQWRLKTQQEIKEEIAGSSYNSERAKNRLFVNPIGLEILSTEYQVDPSYQG